MKTFLRPLVSALLGLYCASVALAVPGPVSYNPGTKIIQGNQPLTASYPLTITGPTPLLYTGPLTINFTVVAKPANVSVAQALAFVSASPSTISFATANQQVVTTITVAVPTGSFAGDYEYLIKLGGWPAGVVDNSVATINARVLPPDNSNSSPPTVTLNTPTGGTATAPATFTIQFNATVPTGGRPIDGLTATFGGVPLSVAATGLGTLNASGTATSPTVIVPGIYTIRVSATNRFGTSFDSADVEVIADGNPPPPSTCAELEWLAPIVHNKTVSGGSHVPIKFTLFCPSTGERFIRDTGVIIAITEVPESGPAGAAVLYPYGSGGPTPPTYSINGSHYQLNFPTAQGTHRYRIEVYRPLSPSGVQLLGTKELNTK